MEYFYFDVYLENNKIDQFESILSKYEEWISNKREIKLLQLLEIENKRIQFDIESISMYIPIGGDNAFVSLQLTAIVANSLSMILNGDNIEKMTLGCTILNTEMGKIIKNIITESFDLTLNIKFNNGLAQYFYIDIPENNAA